MDPKELDRLEEKHASRIEDGEPRCSHCMISEWQAEPYPCDAIRVIQYTRELERELEGLHEELALLTREP